MIDTREGSMLWTAIEIAIGAHNGATDKGGKPYLLHPLRVMLVAIGETDKTVAILHDVIEDTPLTLSDLAAKGFSEEVTAAIDAVTRRAGEPYREFIDRARLNPIARRVKILDIKDNLRPDRAANIPKSLRERYERALFRLMEE